MIVPEVTLNLGTVVLVPVRCRVRVKFAGVVTFSPLMVCLAKPLAMRFLVPWIGLLLASEVAAKAAGTATMRTKAIAADAIKSLRFLLNVNVCFHLQLCLDTLFGCFLKRKAHFWCAP